MDRVEKILEKSGFYVFSLMIVNGSKPFIDCSFFYISGIVEGDFDKSIVIYKDKKIYLLVPFLEEIVLNGFNGEIYKYKNEKEMIEAIQVILKGVNKVGMNLDFISFNKLKFLKKNINSEIIDVSKAIKEVRSIKEEWEIELIKKACNISSEIIKDIPNFVGVDFIEKDIAKIIDGKIEKYGGNGNSFETIVAFDENSAEPHHVPSLKKISKGSIMLFDFGASFKKYCSDVSRTFFYENLEKERRLERAYEVVLHAKEEAEKSVREGVSCSEIDKIARDIIDSTEFKRMFTHSTGHGIGLNIHEKPSVSVSSDEVLKENMIITIEPGIYIQGVGGIRIEDCILVKKNGYENLTKIKEEKIIISKY